jgi:hypothetical protein
MKCDCANLKISKNSSSFRMPLTIEDVQKVDMRKRELKKRLYKELYERASSKVREIAKMGLHETWVTIPSFLMGYPSFDLEMATIYIERQFKNGGFYVKNYGQGQLFISWYLDPKKKMKKKEEPFKPQPPKKEDPYDLSVLVNLKKSADKYKNFK